MAKGYVAPVIRIVALGTLAGVVVGWPRMAAKAVVKAGMIKARLSPVEGIVA